VPNGTTATISRWIRTRFGVFDDVARYEAAVTGNTLQHNLEGFLVASPPQTLVTGSAANQVPYAPNASFFGYLNTNAATALQWGGYNPTTGTYAVNGQLFGDGSIGGNGIINMSGTGVSNLAGSLDVVSYLIASTFRTNVATSTSGSSPQTLNMAVYSGLQINTPTGSGTFTVNVTNCLGAVYNQEFWFAIHQTASNYTEVAVTCDSGITVCFESGTLDNNLSTATATDLYRGHIINGNCFMSVQRFPGV